MLLDEFNVIFDRPEKIKKLREYVLNLAVRGKLVEQDETDEPASVLLEIATKERDRLVKEKKIKKEKSLPEISAEEILYELPKGWQWVRFSQVLDVRDGTHDTPKYVEKGIPLITSKNIDGKDINFSNVKYISKEDHEEISKRSYVDDGDILFAMIGSIGNPVIVNKFREFSIKNVALFKPYKEGIVLNRYLYYYLLLHQSYMKEKASGAVQAFVSLKFLRAYEFALPPLNEQKRIVEKVDFLMEFCDKLEKQLEKKIKYGSLSAKSIFNDVSNCRTYEELEGTLIFIIDNFKDLTLADGAVGELKSTILSLAVRGKLVPQYDNDEPASVLLERIKEEKEKLVKDKKIKKEKPLPEISEDEIPYKLPKGWEWIRMRELAKNIHYGHTASAKSNDTGVKFVRITDIQKNMVNWETVPYCDIDDKKLESCKLENNDILIARTGGTIGKSFIVENVEYCAVFASYLIRVIPLKSIYPRYLKLFLETPLYWTQLTSKSQGTGQPNVNAVSLSELIMPLPPLNEQKRIVDRVDNLFKISDELQLRIEKSKKYSEKLMESILKDSFEA